MADPTATRESQLGVSAELGAYEIFTGKDGRRRLKVAGRGGFPIVMVPGETPEQADARYQAKRAENAAAQAAAPPPPADGPTAGSGDLPPRIADALKGSPGAGTDPPPDPGPRRTPNRPGTLKGPSTAELAKVLEELLTAPAIPMGLPVWDNEVHCVGEAKVGSQHLEPGPGIRPRCLYCRDHFLTAGPQAASELAKLSEQNEPLRRMLTRLHEAWGMMTLTSVLGGYVMAPLLHHLAPEPILQTVGPVLGVPERRPLRSQPMAHPHAPAAAGASSANGAAQPPAGAGAGPA